MEKSEPCWPVSAPGRVRRAPTRPVMHPYGSGKANISGGLRAIQRRVHGRRGLPTLPSISPLIVDHPAHNDDVPPRDRSEERGRRRGPTKAERAPPPVWPAFFAAPMTRPTKVLGFPAPRLLCQMYPGRARSSLSPAVTDSSNEFYIGDGGVALKRLGFVTQKLSC
jgi:hypothetical protein